MRFGVFIYPGTEPIDLATFGVLSMARRIAPQIEIVTIAPDPGQVSLGSGLQVLADYGFDDAPVCDVIVVTGGAGWSQQAGSPRTCAFIRRSVESGVKVLSVCTGAMILAASGVIDGSVATTKRRVAPPERSPLEELEERFPHVRTVEASFVDAGQVITGGGVALCIDATLYAIEKWVGEDVARETARLIEYDRALDANHREFPPRFSGQLRRKTWGSGRA